MTLHIVVTAKQVLDPETPVSAFQIDANAVSVTGSVAPVVNGYDEQAGPHIVWMQQVFRPTFSKRIR